MTGPVDLQWGARAVVTIDGVALHVERAESGPGAGRGGVVLLHGFGSGTFTWAGIAPHLDRHRPLLAWDRPPFGRSARMAPGRGITDPYRLAAELGRAAGLIRQELGAAPRPVDDAGVVLVGHSAGAVLAVQMALDHVGVRSGTAGSADRIPPAASVMPPIRGLVLIAPALDGAPPEIVRRLAGLPGVGVVGGAVLRLAILGAEPALAAMGNHRTPLIAATGRETARLLRRRGTAEALFHLTRTWQPPDVLDHLGALDIPTLVIGGADDRIVSTTLHDTVADALGGDLILYEGVGHAAHEQIPDIVGPRIAAFLDSL